jgi:AraC family transcriptional regulator
MKTPLTHQIECSSSPILSSKNRGWENIVVEQFQHPAGEEKTYYNDEHSICLSLATRPVHLLQIKGGKTHAGLYGQGDISVTPAKTSFFARWNEDDQYLQIRIAADFIQNVAIEALGMNPDRLELIPEFRTRDRQIEAMGMMLLAELQQEDLGRRLYIDSLANVLAVHLLRQYSVRQPRLAMYEGGLSERQLVVVLDYINEYLDRDIKLADLAQLVGIYQYLLQQRIERAKQLLKQTDKSIVDIAFSCGFSSHSHLSKQFRQLTGMTPKAFRATD